MKIFITPPAPKMLPGLLYTPPQQPIFVDVKSTQGRPFKVMPTKKCLGLRYARSLGSALNGKRGRELRIASISQRAFFKALCEIEAILNEGQMSLAHDPSHVADFTTASHKSPKWGALDGMKLHEISNSRRKSLISDLLIIIYIV